MLCREQKGNGQGKKGKMIVGHEEHKGEEKMK